MLSIYINQTEIKLHGHANFADYGHDIVCAGVSTLVQILGTEFCKYGHATMKTEHGNARLQFHGEVMCKEQQIIWDLLITGLKRFANDFPDNVMLVRN